VVDELTVLDVEERGQKDDRGCDQAHTPQRSDLADEVEEQSGSESLSHVSLNNVS